MKFYRTLDEVDKSKYIIATYHVTTTTNIQEAAWNIAIGQSVGNPSIRNAWETDELFETHSCIILEDPDLLKNLQEKQIKIAFPLSNIDLDSDGISQLLCQLMGGQVDINIISSCKLLDIDLPESATKHFLGPKWGLTGFRKFTSQYNKPLLGGIVKPKIVSNPHMLREMVKQMVEGGVDFIKEDEIMGNIGACPLDVRVDTVANYLASQSKPVVFCHTINCDPHIVIDRVKRVYQLGGNGVHINVWSGLGVYNSIRKLDLPIFLHYQSSGAKIFTDTNHKFSISWKVMCQLATLMGVDTIQTGMIGGYSNDNQNDILECIKTLHQGNTIPALSCGFHPGLVDYVTQVAGVDYLANVGGAIHGHPEGTLAGTMAMRQAIDNKPSKEYYTAINKWGMLHP